MGRFWRKNKLLVIAFAVLVAVAGYFAVGAIRHARDFNVAREQPIAPWMTPRYVAHSWGVPRDEMMKILGLEPPPPGRQTLTDIAAQKGITVDQYISQIEAGIAAFRAAQGK